MLEFAGVVLGAAAFLALIFIPLERAFEARTQRVLRAHLTLDLLFLAGQYFMWNALNLEVLRWLHAQRLSAIMWRAEHLPAFVQVVLAVVLGDLTMYALHVAFHRVPWMWRIHTVHHSASELDWAAAHREHPLDGLLTQLAVNLPALMLGISFALLAPIVVFRSVWAVLVHSNTRLPLGPLRWLIGGPELHRYHHRASGDDVKNFANLAPYIDWLFGTHHEPSDETYRLGLDQTAVAPGRPLSSYANLLLLRFRGSRAPTGQVTSPVSYPKG